MATGMSNAPRLTLALLPLFLATPGVATSPPSPAAVRPTEAYVPPEISDMTHARSSELRELVERFVTDRDELLRFYDVQGSELQMRRIREFYVAWRKRLAAMPYDSLGTEGRVDWLLLSRQVDYELNLVDREESRAREMSPLIPFAGDIARLQESRRLMEPVDPQASAATLDGIKKQVAKLQDGLEAGLKADTLKDPNAAEPIKPTKVVAYRSVAALAALRESLDDWYKFYDGYDPAFGWWVRASRDKLNVALDAYVKLLKERSSGSSRARTSPSWATRSAARASRRSSPMR